MQKSIVHFKREEVGPKRVGDHLYRYFFPRSESLSTTGVQPLNLRGQGRLLVTRNTLDQRVTYFGMNFTAGCGQSAMEDPVMQWAMLQVRMVRV